MWAKITTFQANNLDRPGFWYSLTFTGGFPGAAYPPALSRRPQWRFQQRRQRQQHSNNRWLWEPTGHMHRIALHASGLFHSFSELCIPDSHHTHTLHHFRLSNLKGCLGTSLPVLNGCFIYQHFKALLSNCLPNVWDSMLLKGYMTIQSI